MPTRSEDLARRRQQSESVWNHGDFGGQRAYQLAVSLHVDFRLRVLAINGNRRRQVLARDSSGVRQVDAWNFPIAPQQPARYIEKIGKAAGGAAEDESKIVAIERSSGS